MGSLPFVWSKDERRPSTASGVAPQEFVFHDPIPRKNETKTDPKGKSLRKSFSRTGPSPTGEAEKRNPNPCKHEKRGFPSGHQKAAGKGRKINTKQTSQARDYSKVGKKTQTSRRQRT